jgi:arylsulfatase
MIRVTALLVVAACAVAGCDRAPRRADGPPPRQAILIVLDALRADRLSGYGYPRETTPRLDELGRRGMVFTRFFSHATYTRASLSSLFYSRYFALPLIPGNPSVPLVDPEELFRTVDPEAVSLPRAIAAAGIPTAGVSAHSWITTDSPLAAEFDEFHDLSATLDYPPRWHYPRAAQVVDWVDDWLDQHLDRDFFLYVHLMDTHFPHFPEEDARRFDAAGPATPGRFDDMGRPKDRSAPLVGGDRAYLDALYDGSLRYADRQVGRLLDHLAAAGRLETMAIVVTADHGEELLEHAGRFGHGGPWRDVLGRVPLIVHAPGRAPVARVDALAEMVDVAPTVLGLLGIEPPPGTRLDGTDLVAVATGQRPAKRHVVMPQGIRGDRWKALFPAASPLDDDAAPCELYDLAADPGEVHDVAASHPEVAATLIDEFREILGPPHARWRQAVTTETPRSAFAIAASHFRVSPPVATVGGQPALRDLAHAAAPGGWAQSKGTWPRYALLGREGAPRLAIEFPVPDGEYHLTLGMRGACAIDVVGGAHDQVLRSATARDGTPHALHDTEAVQVGVVRVTGQRFRATIEPLPGSTWLLVRSVGFEPVGAPQADPAAAREREDRLRGLGYVE